MEKQKQFANLVAVNDVSQRKVDQEKWKYQRSKDEVCNTKKTKEKCRSDQNVEVNEWIYKKGGTNVLGEKVGVAPIEEMTKTH